MPTIYDIARALGVSQTTVANALKGKSNISEATRQRIIQYAEEVGYRPNVLAQGLAKRKTFNFGFILPTITNPFYSEIAEEMERVALKHSYQVSLCNTYGDAKLGQHHLERLLSRWIDGIIVMGLSMDLASLTEQFQKGLPVVLCNWQENEQPTNIPHVSIDFRLAGQLAAQHLLELGHRHIAIIADRPRQNLRVEGFRARLQEAGISLEADMIEQGDSSLPSGYDATKRLLEREHPPTAIFVANDWMAIGAIDVAHNMGLQVPRDLSIIGLDNVVISAHIHPPLTTIEIPKQQLARTTTEMLLQLIDKSEQSAQNVLIPPLLLPRQSTAEPPAQSANIRMVSP
jgi:DNA-binding LacI/PurR family transcriptional regulator